MGYANKNRTKAIEEAQAGAQGIFWSPPIGTSVVRILAPLNEDDLFYTTHAYHWIASQNSDGSETGKTVWTHRKYLVDGKTVLDPIDEMVDHFYKESKRLNEEQGGKWGKLGGKLKRKRHFFIPVYLLDENIAEEERYKIMVDTSNDGKLISKICELMGFPFYKDVQDKWVDKDSLEIDPDKKYVDLVDPKEGWSLKIKKKKTGTNPWDISYSESFAVEERPLSKTELAKAKELMAVGGPLDINNAVTYEEDYFVLKAICDDFIGVKENEKQHTYNEEKNSKPVPKANKAPDVSSQKPSYENDDIDDLLDELDEE